MDGSTKAEETECGGDGVKKPDAVEAALRGGSDEPLAIAFIGRLMVKLDAYATIAGQHEEDAVRAFGKLLELDALDALAMIELLKRDAK
jgi:hypothetical protein